MYIGVCHWGLLVDVQSSFKVTTVRIIDRFLPVMSGGGAGRGALEQGWEVRVADSIARGLQASYSMNDTL